MFVAHDTKQALSGWCDDAYRCARHHSPLSHGLRVEGVLNSTSVIHGANAEPALPAAVHPGLTRKNPRVLEETRGMESEPKGAAGQMGMMLHCCQAVPVHDHC